MHKNAMWRCAAALGILGAAVVAGFGSPAAASRSGQPAGVTINQGASQADPTSTSPIVFDVLFQSATTDFATGDVSLSGTAGATTAIVTLDPASNNRGYTVEVSGMTQSGTVIATIPAGVAHNSIDVPNPASTSTDNTVEFVLAAQQTTTTTAPAATTTAPATTTTAAVLARTGSSTGGANVAGWLLIAAGGGLVLVARRHRAASAR